jgi:transcriptional regulator GlxA family with amidase domain
MLTGQSQDVLFDKAVESFSWVSKAKIAHVTWISKVQHIIDCEHVPHTLQSLAERVHVHPIYMANAFRKKTGITIGEYQLKSKLTRACGLLLKDHLTVYQIAETAGFHDAAHFVKTFRFYFRETPHKLRMLNRKLIGYNFGD